MLALVQDEAKSPNDNNDKGLLGRKESSPHNNESADQYKQDGVERVRLVRTVELWLAVTEDDGAKNREEEEGKFSETVQSQKGAEVAKQTALMGASEVLAWPSRERVFVFESTVKPTRPTIVK